MWMCMYGSFFETRGFCSIKKSRKYLYWKASFAPFNEQLCSGIENCPFMIG